MTTENTTTTENGGKNIHITLREATLDCSRKGEQIEVRMPDWMPDEISADALSEMVEQIGAREVLYLAVSSALVKIRAAARAGHRNAKTGELMGKAQQFVNNLKISVPSNPAERAKEDLVKAMKNGATPADLKAMMNEMGISIEELMEA